MTCTENKRRPIILRRDQSRVICHIGFLSIFQFETLQVTGKLQARQCIFLTCLLHFLHICNVFISNHYSLRACDYAEQSEERRPINVLAMLRVSLQKM